jgi:mono/diheme cytochrome c family protein
MGKMTLGGLFAVTLLLTCVATIVAPEPVHAFPWSTDMFRAQSVQPLEETPRNQPAETLAANGREPVSLRRSAGLRNPMTTNSSRLYEGKSLFDTTCAPCHGYDGKGDGPVRNLLRVPPADLTNGMPAQVADGYLFVTIRQGNHAMPSYGDALSARETWLVVLYVRSLQSASVLQASR